MGLASHFAVPATAIRSIFHQTLRWNRPEDSPKPSIRASVPSTSASRALTSRSHAKLASLASSPKASSASFNSLSKECHWRCKETSWCQVERTSSRAAPGLRAPHRRGRDRPLNPLKNLRKSACRKVGAHLFALLGGLRTVVMVVGEGGDDAGAQFVRLGMGQFQRRHLLQMVVQQPGVIDQRLQNQRLAAGNRAALAAHDRAHRELRARHLIGLAVDGLAAGRALRARRREARIGPPRPA